MKEPTSPPEPISPQAQAIGNRIRKLRLERNLSQRQLAGPGLTHAYVSRIERGLRKPSFRTLRQIAAILGTTPEYLETGKKAVVTLMLDDYEPFLQTVGLQPGHLSHEDIHRLSKFTIESYKRFPEKNPLVLAVQTLREDIALRKDPASLLEKLHGTNGNSEE